MLTAIENNLISTIKTEFNNTLRAVESVPGPLNESLIKALLTSAPAIYIAFLGGRNANKHAWETTWACYVVTAQGDQKKRRQGEARVIGAYNIIDQLIPLLDGHSIDDAGTFDFQRAQNLFTVSLDKKGISVYAATFTLVLDKSYQANTDAINDFITFNADHSLVPGNDEPAAIDNVTLEQ